MNDPEFRALLLLRLEEVQNQRADIDALIDALGILLTHIGMQPLPPVVESKPRGGRPPMFVDGKPTKYKPRRRLK